MADVEEPMRVMRCRVCDALLKTENLDFRQGIASCAYCNAVMRFETDEPAAAEARPEVALPAKFRVEDLGDVFHIHQRWFTYKAFLLVLFTAFWCGVSFFLFGAALKEGALGMTLFMVPFVIIGMIFVYAVFCCFLNTTTISLGREQLTVRHVPLPCPGGGTYRTADLRQFFCKERIDHSENGTTRHYSVGVVDMAGKRFTILGNLSEANQALFIEQQLERHSGIADEPVTGELPR